MVVFTKHAESKFSVLRRHGCLITREQVLGAVAFPEKIDLSRFPLFIAQTALDKYRVLRVIYKEKGNQKVVITFYPGKKKAYEK